MVSITLIALILLGAIVLLFYGVELVKHYKTKFFIVIGIFLLVFLYFTGSSIVKEHKVDLKTFDGIVTLTRLYFVWLGHAVENIKIIAGNAMKLNWGGNSTLG